MVSNIVYESRKDDWIGSSSLRGVIFPSLSNPHEGFLIASGKAPRCIAERVNVFTFQQVLLSYEEMLYAYILSAFKSRLTCFGGIFDTATG